MFNLIKNVTGILAGRAAILNLQELSQAEKLDKTGTAPFLPSFELKTHAAAMSLITVYAGIWKGSYPKLIASEKNGLGYVL